MNGIINNLQQKWNHYECLCKCKLDDCSSCKDNYMWNPSTWYCECNKASKTGEYLGIKNVSCETRLFGKFVLTCEKENAAY